MTDYTLKPITNNDVDKVMELLKITFYLDEPLNQAVGLCETSTESCPELDEYCTKSILEGLSLKAVDQHDNIIGVIISGQSPLKEEDNGNDLLSEAKRCKNPKFQKIQYILARRETAKLWELYPGYEWLVEIKIVATHPNWRKRGIMTKLLESTETMTRERGINLLRMDTSSAYSAESAKKLGYQCVYRMLYTDILMDGKPIITPEPPHLEDCVFIKKLL